MARNNLSSGPARTGVSNGLLAQLAAYIPQIRGPRGAFLPNDQVQQIARGRVFNQGTGLRNPFPPVAPGTALPTTPIAGALPVGGSTQTYSGPVSSRQPLAIGAGGGGGGLAPIAQAAGGAADDVAAAAGGSARQGLLRQMMGGAPGQFLNRPFSNSMLSGIAGRIPGGAGALRSGLYGIAGNLGGGLLEQVMDQQGWGMAGDILGSAARFAPLGAWGGPLGMAVMGVGGGLWGALTGDRGGDQRSVPERLTDDLSGFVPDAQLAQAQALYSALEGTLGAEAAMQTAYGPLIEQLATGAQQQPAPDVLALQMAAQSMMNPIIAQSNRRIADFEARMNEIIPTLPDAYQSVYAAAVPEAALWQGQMMDAAQLSAQLAPVAEAIRNGQFSTGGDSYANLLANDDILSSMLGG